MLADAVPWICGTCYLPLNIVVLHSRSKATVADVIALCLEKGADVIATGGRGHSQVRVDFSLSSEVFNRASSHM